MNYIPQQSFNKMLKDIKDKKREHNLSQKRTELNIKKGFLRENSELRVLISHMNSGFLKSRAR
jgi:flagellar capping protein FliD